MGASLQVVHVKQVDCEPTLTIRVDISRIGTKSLSVRHIAYQQEAIVFDGSTVMVTLAEDGVDPRAMNESEREWLGGQLLRRTCELSGPDERLPWPSVRPSLEQ